MVETLVNIFKDYDAYAWDVNLDAVVTSSTGKKISYWSDDCSADDRPLSIKKRFKASCHEKSTFIIAG